MSTLAGGFGPLCLDLTAFDEISIFSADGEEVPKIVSVKGSMCENKIKASMI